MDKLVAAKIIPISSSAATSQGFNQMWVWYSLVSSQANRQQIDDFRLEARALAPSEVHAHEHLRPILRFGSARSGVKRKDGVVAVVVAREEQCDTEMQRRVKLDPIASSLGEPHRAARHARCVDRRAGPE